MTDIFELQFQQPHENNREKKSHFIGFLFKKYWFTHWSHRGQCGGDTSPATHVMSLTLSWEAGKEASVVGEGSTAAG